MARGPSLGNYIQATFCRPGLRSWETPLRARPPLPELFFHNHRNRFSMPSAQTNLFYFTINIYPAGSTAGVLLTQNGNLGTWTIGEDQVQLFATGGNGTYTWQVTGGTLPPGMALRTVYAFLLPAGRLSRSSRCCHHPGHL